MTVIEELAAAKAEIAKLAELGDAQAKALADTEARALAAEGRATAAETRLVDVDASLSAAQAAIATEQNAHAETKTRLGLAASALENPAFAAAGTDAAKTAGDQGGTPKVDEPKTQAEWAREYDAIKAEKGPQAAWEFLEAHRIELGLQ